MPCAKKFSKRSIREKRKKIPDILTLYREKKEKEHRNGHVETDE